MLRILRSRPLTNSFSFYGRPFSSNISANPPKEAIISSSSSSSSSSESLINDQAPSAPPPEPAAKKSSSAFLKFAIFGTLAGATAAAGYASYAYTLDEVDEKTKAFRTSAKYTVGDNASSLDKFQALLYSAAMTVPAKAIELYLDLRRPIEEQIRGFAEPSSEKLLPDLHPLEQHIFTLVLDLNETLLYSDWKRERGWRTFKRPGVDAFLEHLAQFYEIVVYSDQQSMYVDPVLERLDQKGCIRYRLSRTATRYQDGKHYRDLSKLNRDPSKILYVSGHAIESCLQPENCVPIKPWKVEADDTVLLDLIPFLEYVARHRPADIRPVLASYQGRDIATEFIARSKDHQRRMLEQRQHGRFWQR
ncbi:mitochondrial import inner membrane translocase subunit TIM50-like [Vitis riparia]|uniref:mitochondrial import inner membrane translocase subunit TIM50-like n=1 Tax=Vitis riparia TaxID=96939 RepID=UPI00155A58F0|nr:mitochondrial import inner membrane translocase subunit TIM50-like [Vitis riparia]